MTILIVGDAKYSGYCTSLAKSILDSGTEFSRIAIGRVGEWNPTFTHSKVIWYSHKPDRITKAYCANVRPWMMHHLMDIYKEDVLYIDADSVLKGDISEIGKFEGLSRFLMRENNKSEKMKVASGVVYVKYCTEGRLFLNSWWKATQDAGVHNWFSDQIGLYEAYKQFESVCCQMDKKYIDWGFNESSLIWTAKGARKDDPTFKNEVSKWT